MKTILLTRPNHDNAMLYLHYAAGELKKEIDRIGECRVIDIEGSKAIRREFEKALDKGIRAL